ncbi:MAG: alkaline phosphatase D family protein [Bryobacterales bacterium]|nr:alkaline phosphatase D family protein [Bryobacterales bacterium]
MRTGRFALLVFPQEEIADAAERAAMRDRLGQVPLSVNDASALVRGARQEDFSNGDLESDTTAVVDVDGLAPDTRYGYLLHFLDGERVLLGHNRLRGFRTPPAYDARRPFQFAVFSCHMPYRKSGLFGKRTEVRNLEMWDYLGATLRRHAGQIDLVIAGGDQCYTDGLPTLEIWRFLKRRMRREGESLLPDEAAMLTWYRDTYCGYWGFASVQEVFDSFPTYMVGDDHEIGDGWGSHDLGESGEGDGVAKMLPAPEEKGLTRAERRELAEGMFRAARRAYEEYEHRHNPPTEDGALDYSFRRGGGLLRAGRARPARRRPRELPHSGSGAVRPVRRVLAEGLDAEETAFLFVVSAVPVLHTRAGLVNADERWLIDQAGLGDDLRDSWEHELHDEERAAPLDVLFRAAAKRIRVCVLSGDVHVSAVFSIDDEEGRRIYQLTSSAITSGIGRPLSWVLSAGAADDGETAEGHRFQRLVLYADSSYALISVDPGTGQAWFKLYGEQKLEPPPSLHDAETLPLNHSVAKIRIF